MAVQTVNRGSKTETRRGILRWAWKMIAMLVVYGAILFAAAGSLDWVAGWGYIGLNIFNMALTALVLIPRQPDLIAERSRVGEGTKNWDRLLTPAVALLSPLAIMVTAGLDARFGWSPAISAGVWALGLALGAGCGIFVVWAMASNPFFSGTVRIQTERDHHVVSSGPYRLVRHPGYLGSVIFDLAAPLALGSLWTYIPGLLSIVLIMVRTGLEDRTLQSELPGYREYAAEVRYRLVPGLW
jgi:protein-S-isoprenylcysteine O-methyltransferase Ste14